MGRLLTIPGDPVPQGSMRAYVSAGKAFTTATSAGPLQRYRNDIRAAHGPAAPTDGAVYLQIRFSFAHPRAHYNASGELKNDTYKTPAPSHVTKKPDIDKLCRAVLDALSGYAYYDDAQVAMLTSEKTYAQHASTTIYIYRVEEEVAAL